MPNLDTQQAAYPIVIGETYIDPSDRERVTVIQVGPEWVRFTNECGELSMSSEGWFRRCYRPRDAAPELLKALKETLETLMLIPGNDPYFLIGHAIEVAKAAIDKAEGKNA